jgi:hypothetical protein
VPSQKFRRDSFCLTRLLAGSSIRLRRLDPSLKPLSFDSVSQIGIMSGLNGDAGVEWLGLERMAEGGQPQGRDASEAIAAAEAAAAPMSARLLHQEQQQAAATLRTLHDAPPLSARGAGIAGATQQQPLSARARVPVALNRGGGSRNTDVVPDDDAANPQPAASRLQQQQHPRLNVVTSSQSEVQRQVPALDLAGLNARMMAAAVSSAASGGSGDTGVETASRSNQVTGSARGSQSGAVITSARAAKSDVALDSARVEAVVPAAAQRDVKRDIVTASNISELRSKVLTCQEEVQRMKEYALELERENASLKQVGCASRGSSYCSDPDSRPHYLVSNSALSHRSAII